MRIGIDLGGTKIELIAFDASGREILRQRVPTPQGDYRATVGAVVSLVADVEKNLKAKATIGVGIPGALSRVTGLVKNANSTCLIGHDLKKGPGTFTVPGLMKVTVVRKPATKARKGTNPFTGEEMTFKAKPARNVVKVRALKALKDMV